MPAPALLTRKAPREMHRALQSDFGNAKLAGRKGPRPKDIADGRVGRQRIGF